ncbi:MAG TPA: hypothetical protein PKG84_09120 [Novosphingobium sp.]|nr:hypothetical protein [Novosphingobium sp.]
MQWKYFAAVLVAAQVVAQLLLLFMLEPGFDLTAVGFVALRRVAIAYLAVSILGGLFVSRWITIVMAAIPVLAAAILAVAYWFDPAPLRSLRRWIAARAPSAAELVEQQPGSGPDGKPGG